MSSPVYPVDEQGLHSNNTNNHLNGRKRSSRNDKREPSPSDSYSGPFLAKTASWPFHRHLLSLSRYVFIILQSLFSVCFMTVVLIHAIVLDLKKHHFWVSPLTILRSFTGKLPNDTLVEHVHSCGYNVVEHHVKTEDGFLLTLHRISARDQHGASIPPSKGPVLLQHGLFNTGVVFVFTGRGKALAFALADQGYDVFLGNNRGNIHSRRHIIYHQSEDQFWDYSIDDLALDVKAFYCHILSLYPPSTQLVYIGHSQGSTQALMAFAEFPELQAQTRLAAFLSPAVYVKELYSMPLRLLASLYARNPKLFYAILGRGPFMPMLEHTRRILPPLLWTYLSQTMFSHLFNWSTDNWDSCDKPMYFHETPSYSSTRNLAHWLQFYLTGKFIKFTEPIPKTQSSTNGLEAMSSTNGHDHDGCLPEEGEVEEVDLSVIKCPIALVHGANDHLIDVSKLSSKLSNVVYKRELTGYYHLDCLSARNANTALYPDLLHLLNEFHHDRT